MDYLDVSNSDPPVSILTSFQTDIEVEKENFQTDIVVEKDNIPFLSVSPFLEDFSNKCTDDYNVSIIDIAVQKSQENLSTQISLNCLKGEIQIDQEVSNFDQKEELDNCYPACKLEESENDILFNGIDNQLKSLTRESINRKFLSRLCRSVDKSISSQVIFKSNNFQKIPSKYRNASYDKVKEFFSLNVYQLYQREKINLDVSFSDQGKKWLLLPFSIWAEEYLNSDYFISDLKEIKNKLSSKYCENYVIKFIKLYARYNSQLVGIKK